MARVSAFISERAAFFGSCMPATESSACVKCRLVLKVGGCVDAKGKHPVALGRVGEEVPIARNELPC
eukprot:5996498-Pleurochrysis_carterae.AAC.1